MTTPVGITTVRRPGAEYLDALLGEIKANAGPRRVVIAPTMPGDVTTACLGREVLEPLLAEPEACAEKRNNRRCLETNADRLIAHMAKDHDAFLILQDDCIAAPAAWERIDQVVGWMRKQANVAWVSFYTPYGEAGATHQAFWKFPPNKFYGDVAVLWNRAAALEFLPHSRPSEAHDLMMQQYFSRPDVYKRWRCLAHSPCLFQHVGVVSAMNHAWGKGQRTTMNFHPKRHSVKGGKPFPLKIP